MSCVACRADSATTTTTYVLLEHSPVEVGSLGRDKIVRRVIEPYTLPLCTPCLERVQRSRRRAKQVAAVALGGVALAMGYFVGTFAGASSAVVLAFLFGGFGLFAVGGALLVVLQRALIASLPLADNRGRNILLVTASRDELDREIDKHRLASAEIRNQLERGSDAEPLPPAKLR